jgi:N-sulfoglucosamine sulfohydrolase
MKPTFPMLAQLTAVLIALSVMGADAYADRPNILFVISDDQSYPHTSAYGCTWVETPGFDRIAREGLLFNNAYTTNAKCAPSRSSIVTGRYSWSLEAAGNHVSFFRTSSKPSSKRLKVRQATMWVTPEKGLHRSL